jgi:hypothetical protein
MAKLLTQQLTITVSKLVRECEPVAGDLIEPELVDSIEAVITELVGKDVMVEVSLR